MDGETSVTAIFTQIFSLTTSASPAEGGTVTPEGSNSYASGTQVPVTASPNAGYAFTNWTGDCTGSDACLVTLDSNKTVTATFQLLPTPTPSPAGPSADAIVFTSGRDGLQQIYTMASDGTNQQRLTTPESAVSPSWSADKTKIVFISGGHDIAVMNHDGSNLYTAVPEAAVYGVSEPDLSPDGNKIATGSSLEGLYVVNVDGTNVTQITTGRDSAPDWSPDGTKILFTRSTPSENRDLYTVSPDGSNEVRLTTTEFDESRPAWSPDGTKIAFEYLTDAWTMNADGTNRIVIGVSGDQSRLSWSPDGSKLTYTQVCAKMPECPVNNNEIWVIDADYPWNPVNISKHSASDSESDW